MTPVSDRQELPELNEVTEGSRMSLVLMPSMFLAIAIVFAAAIIRLPIHHHPKHAIGYFVLAFGLIFAFTFLSIVVGVFWKVWKDGCWKTDERGITQIKIIGQRFIAWEDVSSAEDQWSRESSQWKITLWTNRGLVFVDASNPFLGASVLQHLRRLGKADKLHPPASVLSLFVKPEEDSIPDIDWTLKHRLIWWRTVFCGLSTLIMTYIPAYVIYVYVTSPGEIKLRHWLMLFCIVIILPIYIWFTILGTRTAKSFSLRKDHFIAVTVWGSITVPWTDVKKAYWAGSWYGDAYVDRQPGVPSPSRIALAIEMQNKRPIYIPWDWDDKESTELLKTVTRRLKMLPLPLRLLPPNPILRIDE